MSRIADLIAEHCPNGVEFKALGDIGELVRGRRFTKADYVETGLGSIHYGEVYTEYGTAATEVRRFVRNELRTSLRLAHSGDLVIAATGENVEEVGKAVAWLGAEDVAVHDDCYIFRHSLDPKYVAYFFQSASFQEQKKQLVTESKLARISGKNLEKIKMPIPPLAVQREIVSILDKMEDLQAELQADLQAELQARSRQYEFYRDHLLTCGDADVPWSTLGEIATNRDSRRRPVTKGAREPGPYPYYGASGVVDYVNDYIFEGDYLLVSEDGANLLARSTPIAFSASGRTWINNHAHVLEFEDYASRRFAEFYLNSIDLSPFITGATQPKLNKANLNRIPVPAPSRPEQERIVAILDRFDALVNDLSVGLPAEIRARRQQYEYYRDKLLTFPERLAAA